MSMQIREQPPGSTRHCVTCGRSIEWNMMICPYCGHDYRARAMPAEQVPSSRLAGWAGGLIIASGFLGLLMGILMLVASTFSFSMSNLNLPSNFTVHDLKNLLAILGTVFIVFGVLAIIGGVLAMQRTHLPIAVIGGVFGVLAIGFFVGALLALIGIIILIMARHEFARAPMMSPAYMPPPMYGAPPPNP